MSESDSIVDRHHTNGERVRGLSGSPHYPLVVIALAVISHGGFSLSGQGFTPFYPFIQDDFGLSRTQIGIITSTIFGAATLTSPGLGWTVDRFGVRLMAGGLMVVSGLVVMSLYFTTSFFSILVVAAAMGSLRPVGHPAGAKAIVDWIGPARRGIAMSIKQAGNPILGSMAAAVVPPLAVAFGWRVAALALGTFILLGGIAIVSLYRDRPTSPRDSKPQTSLIQGMRQVMRNRDVSFSIAFGFPLVGTQVATLTYFILYLNDELGVPIIAAGLLLATLQVSNIFMRIGWGVISDTLGGGRRKPTLFIAGMGTALMLLTIALLPLGTPMWGLVLVAIGIGATATSWVSVHSVLLAELAAPGQVGTTVGYASAVSRASIVITPPIFGLLADTLGYQAAWLALVVAILVGMSFLFLVREARPVLSN